MAVAWMLMLLLSASCVLGMNESENSSCLPGLDVAGQKIGSSNLSIGQGLAAPDPVSPSGILNTGNPTYTWVGVADCLYYCLEVRDYLDNVVLKQWYDAADFPAAPATCSVTPLQSLEPGDYSWSVLCWNCLGSQLSQEMDFTVCTSTAIPGKATLISPNGLIGSMNPTFVWIAVNGCTQYCLKVADVTHQNQPIFEQCYDVEEVLSGRVCSITPELNLPAGNYRWWVQAVNCKGKGPWSNFMSFRYMNVPPGRSTPISPQGLISTSTPTFTWTAALAATKYNLQVINISDYIVAEEFFDAYDVTRGLRCSARLSTVLPDDDVVYFWRIQASNDAGDGPWSSYKYFEIVGVYEPKPGQKKARAR